MSIQFNELPADVQQLIFATAIVDSPRTGVKLSAVDKEIRGLVRQGCVWQPLANALGVDISQFNPSVHTREIIELHDFQPVADILQQLVGEEETVPRTRTEAQEWIRKMDSHTKEVHLRDVLLHNAISSQKWSTSQILEICRMLLQEQGELSDFPSAYKCLIACDTLLSQDIATYTEFIFLLLPHYSWPTIHSYHREYPTLGDEEEGTGITTIPAPDNKGDGTWESILQDQKKMDIIFCVTYDLLRKKPLLLDSVMARLFQRRLVPSNSALNEISINRGAHGKEYKRRMLEIQKQTKPSLGEKLLAIAQSIRNFFTKK